MSDRYFCSVKVQYMLTVQDIAKQRLDKVMHNHQQYKEILNDVMLKIKQTNEASSSQNCIVYHVPFLNSQHSLYNVKHAIKYVIKRVQRLGFKVDTQLDKIRIDWSIVDDIVQNKLDDRTVKKKRLHPDAWRFKC